MTPRIKYPQVLRNTDNPPVIVAETAEDIQPAIDELAEKTPYGGSGSGVKHIGGVVQLLNKAYYPEDTIFLKRGVMVRGVNPSPKQHVNPANETYSGGGTTSHNGTVIYTSEMPTGPAYEVNPTEGSHSYRHFNTVSDHRDFDNDNIQTYEGLRDVTHPHLPVFVWKNQMPIHTQREPTQKELDEWADGAGIADMLLYADEQRYWDPANESSGSEREKHATYFGVYDALLMENVQHTFVLNVQTANFLGYNGFYQDAVNVSSIGNHYGVNGVGTATDHHGSTLTLDYSFRVYVKRGMWNVNVTGPTPTVKGSGHLTERFIGDGPVRGKIAGRTPVFLGTESDYDAGNAPIVDPAKKNVVFNHVDQHTEMWDYTIKGHDNTIGTIFDMDDNNVRLYDCRLEKARDGINVQVSELWIRGCDITNFTRHGIRCGNHTPHLLESTYLNGSGGSSVGVWVDNTTNAKGGMVGCFLNVNNAFQAKNDGPAFFANSCTFRNVDTSVFKNDPSAWKGSIRIGDPLGYINENAASETFSGDGSTTTFTFTHGMDEEPQYVTTSFTSADAQSAGPIRWGLNDSDGDGFSEEISVTFNSAPASGTDNVSFGWSALGWSHPSWAN